MNQLVIQQSPGELAELAANHPALDALEDDPRFQMLDHVRNLVGHRLSGRRAVSGGSHG